MSGARIHEYLRANADRFVRELSEFVSFPTVSSASHAGHHMSACAAWVARHLHGIGARDARVVPTGRHPAVLGRLGDDPARPTVLVYGHYDVQPADPLDEWRWHPFMPVVQNGYIYGRGASDDKGQLFAHLKAVEMVRRLCGRLPVNLVFLVEGEEEIGSPSLPNLLRRCARYLASDVAVVSDMPVLAPDRPTLTYALRGDLYLDVEVGRPSSDLHSGNFGGTVENALRALVSALSRLHRDNGSIAVPGFYDDVDRVSPEERGYMRRFGPSESDIRHEAGGAPLSGDGAFSAYERTSIRPSLEIAGVTGGYSGSGVKGVIPSRAGAKIDVRLVPRQSPDRVHRQIFDYLRRFVPRALRLRTKEQMRIAPVVLDRRHPAALAAINAYKKAFNEWPAFVRSGGSIPVVSALSNILDIPTVLMGFALPDDRPHAPNERFSLSMLSKGIVTSAAFFEEMARS